MGWTRSFHIVSHLSRKHSKDSSADAWTLNFSGNNCSSINLKCVCMHVRDQNEIFIIIFILTRSMMRNMIVAYFCFFRISNIFDMASCTHSKIILPVEWFWKKRGKSTWITAAKAAAAATTTVSSTNYIVHTKKTETLNKAFNFWIFNNKCSTTNIQNKWKRVE